jgi:CRP-like cAMP-binding protein
MARSTPDSHAPQQNHLLAALPATERAQIYPHLQLVEMPLGKVVYEPGDVLRYAYFPTDCIVSLLYVLEDGASTEISIVGKDGLIGLTLFMGGGTTPRRAVVQSGGHAYRLLGHKLSEEFHRNAVIRLLLLRYTQALITQMAQAVGKLQRLGVISHSRGHIRVLDRPALERLSCECYAVVKKETDRLLPRPQG